MRNPALHLCRKYANSPFLVQFDFYPWQTGATDLLEHGKLDLALHMMTAYYLSHLLSEELYREDWICAVARDSDFGESLSLQQYLAADHIAVPTLAGSQTIPDKQLAALGVKRNSRVRIPYFGVAIQCLAGTQLVLTLTTGMRSVVEGNRKLRLVKAPRELQAFHFLMAWHPRLNSDPRHLWLRDAIRSTAANLD